EFLTGWATELGVELLLQARPTTWYDPARLANPEGAAIRTRTVQLFPYGKWSGAEAELGPKSTARGISADVFAASPDSPVTIPGHRALPSTFTETFAVWSPATTPAARRVRPDTVAWLLRAARDRIALAHDLRSDPRADVDDLEQAAELLADAAKALADVAAASNGPQQAAHVVTRYLFDATRAAADERARLDAGITEWLVAHLRAGAPEVVLADGLDSFEPGLAVHPLLARAIAADPRLALGRGLADAVVVRLAERAGFTPTTRDGRDLWRLAGPAPLLVADGVAARVPLLDPRVGSFALIGELWRAAGDPVLEVGSVRVHQVARDGLVHSLVLEDGELVWLLVTNRASGAGTERHAWRTLAASLPTASPHAPATDAGSAVEVGTPEAAAQLATGATLRWELRADGTLWLVPGLGSGTRAPVTGTITGADLTVLTRIRRDYDDTDAENRVLAAIAEAAFARHGITTGDTERFALELRAARLVPIAFDASGAPVQLDAATRVAVRELLDELERRGAVRSNAAHLDKASPAGLWAAAGLDYVHVAGDAELARLLAEAGLGEVGVVYLLDLERGRVVVGLRTSGDVLDRAETARARAAMERVVARIARDPTTTPAQAWRGLNPVEAHAELLLARVAHADTHLFAWQAVVEMLAEQGVAADRAAVGQAREVLDGVAANL